MNSLIYFQFLLIQSCIDFRYNVSVSKNYLSLYERPGDCISLLNLSRDICTFHKHFTISAVAQIDVSARDNRAFSKFSHSAMDDVAWCY